MKAWPFLIAVLLTLPFTSALVSTNDLITYHTLDDADLVGSVYSDVHGSYDGTLYNTPTTGVTGILGEAVTFTRASNEYMNLTENAVNLSFAADFGISLWLKTTDTTTQEMVVSNKDAGSGVLRHNYELSIISNQIWASVRQSGSNIIATKTLNQANSWYHVVMTVCGNEVSVYLNNSIGTNATISAGREGNTDSHYVGRRGTGQHFDGTIDELAYFDTCLNPTNVSDLYNNGAGLAYPFNVPVVKIIDPVDNDHSNNIPQNYTINVSNVASSNCSLYINAVINQTKTGIGSGVHSYAVTMHEGSSDYYVSCMAGATEFSDGNQTIFMDYTRPDVTIKANNFYASDNSTVLNKHTTPSVTWNITLDDTYLWSHEILLKNSTGAVWWNYTRIGLTTSEERISNTTNIGGYPAGVWTAHVYVEDDHTISAIPDYDTSPVANGREWITDSSLILEVTAPGATITTEKAGDRYTFDASFAGSRATTVFLLRSSEPLHYRGELYPFPSFVTGKHWVDFNAEQATSYEVTDQGYALGMYRYQVRINHNPSASLHFNSLGGLNNYLLLNTFNISNTPSQVENLTANNTYFDAVYLSWDTRTGTNHTLLYQDGVNIWNGTDTAYNVTGLNSGVLYNFAAYAANLTDVNTALSNENNITVRTLFNTTVWIAVYSEQSLQLVPNSTITFIGPENITITDLDGNFTFADLTPGSYTMRHTAQNYGIRDQYITVANETTYSTNLYILSTVNSTLLPRKIIDYQGREVEGAVINLQRFFSNYSAYITVESTTSGDGGLFNLYYQPFDAWYKIQVLYNGVLKKTTTAQRWSTADSSTTESIAIDVSTNYLESLIPSLSMSAGNPITYDESTRCFTYSYADTAGIVDQVCLTVYEYLLGRVQTQRNQTCSSASSATLVTCHAATNNSVAGEAYLYSNTEYSDHIVAWLEIINKVGKAFAQSWGAYAMFIGILIIMVLALVSGANPAYPIVFGTLGLILTAAVSFTAVSFSTAAGITVVAMALIGLFAWRAGK